MRAETVEEPRLDGKHIVFTHYMENYLNSGGRLIIGPYWHSHEDSVERQILSWGITPEGYSEKSNYRKSEMFKKVLWFEKD